MYEEICEENRGLLVMMARRYERVCALDRAVSMDDLMQAGALGLMRAAQTFDPDAGKGWPGWACWHIQMEFNSVLGLRNGRFTRPHTGAAALDRPIARGESEGATEGDLLADESLPGVDEALMRQELAQGVRAAVGRLKSDGQRRVVQLCKLDGWSYQEAARRMGVSVGQAYQLFFRAANNLARDPRLIRLAEAEGHKNTRRRRGQKGPRGEGATKRSAARGVHRGA